MMMFYGCANVFFGVLCFLVPEFIKIPFVSISSGRLVYIHSYL